MHIKALTLTLTVALPALCIAADRFVEPSSATKGGRAVSSGSSPLTVHVEYSPTDEAFSNPERGFYRNFNPYYVGTERTPLRLSALRALRESGVTTIRAYYVIDEFRDGPLSPSALEGIDADFGAVREAGIKIVPRFAYVFPCAGDLEPCDLTQGAIDAPLTLVLQHIDQLAPLLQANADVIALMEMGFVGAWGEWHHSANRLVNADGTINASSTAIVDRVLSALPLRRTAALRYPYHKQALTSTNPLTASQAFGGTPIARLGEHNDCFLGSADDVGTYSSPYPPFGSNPELFKQYLSLDNRFVPQTGETCSSAAAAQPFIACTNALKDLARMHWSLLNLDYQPEVIDLWRQQGCFGEIEQRLGYRVRLLSVDAPTQAAAGSLLRVRLSLANDGWAAPFNPRAVELVLRHTASRTLHVIPVNSDPRLWGAGETQLLDVSYQLPVGLAAGSYRLFLNLPDPEPALRGRPEYSIRLANAELWEPSSGYNDLQATITIGDGVPAATVVLEPPILSGATATLRWRVVGPVRVMEYRLEAGSSAGLNDLYSASVGAGTKSVTVAVGAGRYFVRVRGVDSAGNSAASNEVSFLSNVADRRRP